VNNVADDTRVFLLFSSFPPLPAPQKGRCKRCSRCSLLFITYVLANADNTINQVNINKEPCLSSVFAAMGQLRLQRRAGVERLSPHSVLLVLSVALLLLHQQATALSPQITEDDSIMPTDLSIGDLFG